MAGETLGDTTRPLTALSKRSHTLQLGYLTVGGTLFTKLIHQITHNFPTSQSLYIKLFAPGGPVYHGWPVF